MRLQEVAGGSDRAPSVVDHAPGGLAVQGDAESGRDGPVDGGGDERVDELQGFAAGEDAGAAQGVGGVGGLLVAESGDGGGELGMDLGAEDRAGPGEADGRGAEAFEAGDQAAALDGGREITQEVRRVLGGGDAAVVHLGGQLDRLEGVARGHGPAFPAERVVGARAERLPYETGDGDGTQRFQVEGASAGPAGQCPERLGVVGQFVGPVGDDDQQRKFLGAGCERGQPAQRFGVGPVGVVEHQHHRGAQDGEMGEHPVESVPQALRVGRRPVGRGAQAECGADDVEPTAQLGTEIGFARAGELRLQQLPGDVEGDPLFLLAAAGGQHGAASGGGTAADLGEQGRLADAGPAGDSEYGSAGTPARFAAVCTQPGELSQRLVDRGEFTLPLQESPSAAHTALHHGASPVTTAHPRGERAHTVTYRHLSVRLRGAGRARVHPPGSWLEDVFVQHGEEVDQPPAPTATASGAAP